jgi:hypothetical protein
VAAIRLSPGTPTVVREGGCVATEMWEPAQLAGLEMLGTPKRPPTLARADIIVIADPAWPTTVDLRPRWLVCQKVPRTRSWLPEGSVWSTARVLYPPPDSDESDETRMVSNEHAVRQYWETLGPQMSPPSSTEQQRAAIQGAQGNLLHAVKLHELWSKPGVVRSPDVVPQGLQGMLDELWERIGKLSDEDNARAEDGLSLLCAAQAHWSP